MQQHITQCISRIMRSHGVTQSRLAIALNCSQTAISNLLRGKSKLTIDDLAKIASVLGITFNELISEANEFSQKPMNISEKAESYICSSSLAFYLINKLKQPSRIEDLQKDFEEDKKNEIQIILKEFKNLNLLIENPDGYLELTFQYSQVLHYRLTSDYSKRLIDIYSKLRPFVNSISKSEKKIQKWKQKNVDAFYFDFFTENQVFQQNIVLRQFLDLVKHQIRMNEAQKDKKTQQEKSELRIIFTTSAPFLSKEILEEYV